MPPRNRAQSEPSPRPTPGSSFHTWWRTLRLLLAALAGWHAVGARASDPTVDLFPRAAAGYMVAINGKPRWARAPDAQRAPASLTKVLTALVLLEGNWQPHAQILVSPRAAHAPGARL